MINPLVHKLLETSASRTPDKTAVVDGARRMSYAELNQQANRLASELITNGLFRGDRVVIYLEDSLESIIALYAILKAGGVFVLLNAGVKALKLGYILKDTAAAGIVTDRKRIPQLAEALKDTSVTVPRIVVFADKLDAIRRTAESSILRHSAVIDLQHLTKRNESIAAPLVKGANDRDLAALIYTSGSSGLPKGVMCAHYNMIAAIQSIVQYLYMRAHDIVLNLLPLSFDYGLYQVLMCIYCGATVIIEKIFAYPYRVLQILSEERITGFPIVPTMAAILSKLSKTDISFNHLRFITSTGDVLTGEMISRIKDMFPRTKLYSMYGLTECKRVSYLEPAQLAVRPTSVGLPIPNSQVFIMDEEGRSLGPGEVGELVVKGKHVMQGYWNAPEESAQVFRISKEREEAILYTRDLFKTDADGYLYFVGRKSEMIKSRCDRISPKEIEMFLNGIDGVLQSSVVGVPDEIAGQLIKACLVIAPGKPIHPKTILKICKEKLEPGLVPDQICILGRMPINPRGKIDRQRLVHEPCFHMD